MICATQRARHPRGRKSKRRVGCSEKKCRVVLIFLFCFLWHSPSGKMKNLLGCCSPEQNVLCPMNSWCGSGYNTIGEPNFRTFEGKGRFDCFFLISLRESEKRRTHNRFREGGFARCMAGGLVGCVFPRGCTRPTYETFCVKNSKYIPRSRPSRGVVPSRVEVNREPDFSQK